jgi:hypothetical protein
MKMVMLASFRRLGLLGRRGTRLFFYDSRMSGTTLAATKCDLASSCNDGDDA